MKALLSFLRGISIIYLSLFLPFFYCSSDVDVQTEEMQPLTDVLTFELSFGDEKTIEKDEFLLARPGGMAVNDKEDIFVMDEGRIKVFDKNGKEKIIIGHPGQGPGEFGSSVLPRITETGYIFAAVDNSYRAYNIFDPDYNFVECKNLHYSGLREKLTEEHNWTFGTFAVFRDAYAYSPEELLFTVSADERIEGKRTNSIYAIVFMKDKDVKTIYAAKFPVEKINIDTEKGRFYYGLLRERRVIYTFAPEHKTFENGKWFYSLFIYDLKTHEQTEIKKAYTPVAIPDSIIYRPLDVPDGIPEDLLNQAKEKAKERSKKLEKLKVYPAVKNLITDGNFIFVFTFEYDKEKGQVVDIFDSATGKYIHSAYFPRWVSILTVSDYSCIKNGSIYRMKAPLDEFAIIEVYKIDPAVYRK